MAGNPFRRTNPGRPADGIPQGDTAPPSIENRTTKKKVTIQTPPRSPEEPPRRLSAGRLSPPPPPKSPDDDNDSDSTAAEDPGLEEALRNTRRNSGSLPPPPSTSSGTSTTKAPYNPFARTLATQEAEFGLEQTLDRQQETTRQDGEGRQRSADSKAPLDVDEFKNILLTGNPGPSSTAWRLQDNSSSTDGSSVSRQSLFDPSWELQQETPRTSIDQGDGLESPSDTSSDDEDSNLMNVPDRLDDLAPPAPPKHTHGKPISSRPQNVSFSDFEESIRSTPAQPATSTTPIGQTASEKKRPMTLHRSTSDLNKPLPAPPPKSPTAPVNTSGVSDDIIPSMQQPTQMPTNPSDLASQKKAPPPPPAARRTGPERNRSDSNPNRGRDSTRTDEEVPQPTQTETTAKAIAPPPPPPARKPRPTSQSATPPTGTPREALSPAPPVVPTEAKSIRPPPPPRNNTTPRTALQRTSSSASHSSASRIETTSSSLNAPPAPPPRRSGLNSNRTSMDGRPPSLSERRRSSEYSGKGEKLTSLSNLRNVTETGEANRMIASSSEPALSQDILADMTAFQAEIDALRARAGNAG